MEDLVLIVTSQEEIIIGKPHHMGIRPLWKFKTFDELRRFAMGILGFCEHFQTEIPEVYRKAFKEE